MKDLATLVLNTAKALETTRALKNVYIQRKTDKLAFPLSLTQTHTDTQTQVNIFIIAQTAACNSRGDTVNLI